MLQMIARSINVEVAPTVHELAEAFCSASGEEQAEFFNEVARLASGWRQPFAFQMQNVVSCGVLLPMAVQLLKTMSDYAAEPEN